MPRTPRSPMVLRQRVTLRILAAARTRSLLLISLATAAAISGMMAFCIGRSWGSVVASSRRNSRNSPTVMLAMERKASRS